MLILSEMDLQTICAALRVAAVNYATDANIHRDNPRLNKGFLDQARKANDLADRIEMAESVRSTEMEF